MEDNASKYEELGLTVDQKDKAWNYISEMQFNTDEKTDGEQLKKLLDDDHFTFVQKLYIAYLFGRVKDKWEELMSIEADAE